MLSPPDDRAAHQRARKARNQRNCERRKDDGRAIFKLDTKAAWAEAYVRRQRFPLSRDPDIAEITAALQTIVERGGK